MTDNAIELRGVRKRFGKTEAVRGIDLSVPRGSARGPLARRLRYKGALQFPAAARAARPREVAS